MDLETSNSAEEQARKNGWTPKEEYSGDPSKWKSAEAFNETGEMIGRFKKSESQVRQLAKQVEQANAALKKLGEIQAKTEDRVREETINELRDLKAKAVKEGDGKAVVEIDDRLDNLKEEERQAVAQPPADGPSPAVASFEAAHPELAEDPVLGGAFMGILQQNIKDNPNGDVAEMLNEAMDTLKERMPQFFDGEEIPSSTQNRGSKVSESTGKRARSTNKTLKVNASDLSEEQLAFGKTFVRTGAFKSLDEYAADLAKIGEL